MEIKVYCYECGDELEIIEEYSSKGDLIVSVERCACEKQDDKYNKIITKFVDEH